LTEYIVHDIVDTVHGIAYIVQQYGSGSPMKAIIQDKYGSGDVLETRVLDKPQIGDDEILVRVHAASVHVGDWILMTGSPFVMRFATGLRKPKNPVPGTDVAGIVEAVGKDVTGIDRATRSSAGAPGRSPSTRQRPRTSSSPSRPPSRSSRRRRSGCPRPRPCSSFETTARSSPATRF
jgi:Alcohol dehydrogenase GroES-like domain